MNLSFIKLDINILNDSKIKFIRKMPDGDKIIILWIGILCLGMKSNNPGVVEIGEGIPFTSEMLATEFELPLNTVKLGLNTFSKLKMVEIWGNEEIYIVNFEKHQALEKIKRSKEISRKSSEKYRKKAQQISNVTVTSLSRDSHFSQCDGHVTPSDETDKDNRIDKDQEQEKGLHQNNATDSISFIEGARVADGFFCPKCTTQHEQDAFACINCGEIL